MSGSSSSPSTSSAPSRKRRCFLDRATARNPSKAMAAIWQNKLQHELQFVTDVTELELHHGDILVTERPDYWANAPARVVNCQYMFERVSSKLGITYARTPSPEPEAQQSPPLKRKQELKQKQRKLKAAKVQHREYKYTLDELRQMTTDVENELATELQADIELHLNEASLPAATRTLLQRAAVHLLGHRIPPARVVNLRESYATAAAAAPVLYVTVTGIALPALPAIVI